MFMHRSNRLPPWTHSMIRKIIEAIGISIAIHGLPIIERLISTIRVLVTVKCITSEFVFVVWHGRPSGHTGCCWSNAYLQLIILPH